MVEQATFDYEESLKAYISVIRRYKCNVCGRIAVGEKDFTGNCTETLFKNSSESYKKKIFCAGTLELTPFTEQERQKIYETMMK